MVDKIIRWIVEALRRQGFIILSKEEYAVLINKPCAEALTRLENGLNASYDVLFKRAEELEDRIAGLEHEQQAALSRRDDDPTPAEIWHEWVYGETKPYE